MKALENNISKDYIINGNIALYQFKKGYRVGLDALLLASMVPNETKPINILELGAGVGAVTLSITYRIPLSTVTAIEKSLDYYQLLVANIQQNKFAGDRIVALNQDILDCKKLSNKFTNQFDVVVTNPPYFKVNQGVASKNSLKAIAHMESSANLDDFINIAYLALRTKGKLIIIINSTRILEALQRVKNRWGAVSLYPIYSYKDSSASRVILIFTKGSKEPFKVHAGIIMHNQDGSYSKHALDIIQDGNSFFNYTINVFNSN